MTNYGTVHTLVLFPKNGRLCSGHMGLEDLLIGYIIFRRCRNVLLDRFCIVSVPTRWPGVVTPQGESGQLMSQSGYRSCTQIPSMLTKHQGVTKRCRLSWLTNSALVQYMSPNEGGGGFAGSQPLSTAVPNAHGNKLRRSDSIYNIC
jgi:hypothetical protein